MATEVFDNSTGFRPSGRVLKYWGLLPQLSSKLDDETIPPLFGAPKPLTLQVLLLSILLVMESSAIYLLDNEGVPYLMLVILSALDFIVAVLPVLYYVRYERSPHQIKSTLFILQTKLRIPHALPAEYENEGKYKDDLRNKERVAKRHLLSIRLVEGVAMLSVLAFGVWKLLNYHGELRNDLWFSTPGRYILGVVALSMVVHLSMTRTLLISYLFHRSLGRQRRAFHASGQNRVASDETDKATPLVYRVKYTYETAGRQMIVQEVLGSPAPSNGDQFELTHGLVKHVYTRRFNSSDNVFLVHSGLILDSEIHRLYSSQIDVSTKRALIAQAKEVQLSQLN